LPASQAARELRLPVAEAPWYNARAMSPTIRRAGVGDVPHIQRLISRYAAREEMLARSLNEIYEGLRDYLVAEHEGQVIGCAACHVVWDDLAEIKSVAVAEAWQGKGVGKRLVETCLEDARGLGVARVFVLTFRPEWFRGRGFTDVDKAQLPHKIWTDCINCPKFPDCGEVALIRALE
jgi:amino-acid N-acetyltransferase